MAVQKGVGEIPLCDRRDKARIRCLRRLRASACFLLWRPTPRSSAAGPLPAALGCSPLHSSAQTSLPRHSRHALVLGNIILALRNQVFH